MPTVREKPTKEELEKYKKTEEYKKLIKRTGAVELAPIHEHIYGGVGIWGDIPDKHGNLVYQSGEAPEIGPFGDVLLYEKPEHQRLIYAIFNCPALQSKIVLPGERVDKTTHRFKVVDLEAEGREYAEKMALDVEYKNKIYQYDEDTLNFLSLVCGLATQPSMNIKKAALCGVWDNGAKTENVSGAAKRAKLKEMMDSPDMKYFETAYMVIREGDANKQEGFYKTENGVYKYNDQILGTSIEHVVAYLKSHDEIFVAVKKKSDKPAK